jgi:hypothetical protein
MAGLFNVFSCRNNGAYDHLKIGLSNLVRREACGENTLRRVALITRCIGKRLATFSLMPVEDLESWGGVRVHA